MNLVSKPSSERGVERSSAGADVVRGSPPHPDEAYPQREVEPDCNVGA